MNAEEVRELLPWYAAGTLSIAETRAVEAELSRSPQLQRELEEYRALGRTVAEVPAEEPAFRPELLQDARRRIDAYEQTQARRAEATPPEGFFAQLKQTLFGGWAAMPVGVRVALAGQFALILVLGGVVLFPAKGDAEYLTSSGPETVAASGPRFAVSFQPEATEADIRALLDSTRLEIVGGPSGQGTYTLGFAAGVAEDPAAALNGLRANPEVVRFASPAGQ